ncbi:Cysteine-rich protein [Spironucleus salmonicida]|uniref:Cysteine-rich protein n=1 Tax=Spironucleus salmonicida TaxID=348837 RepID=A0A9P8LVJ9_9EUKA|nr:Cysteine-rich protein [Spironucleus salmonicida]
MSACKVENCTICMTSDAVCDTCTSPFVLSGNVCSCPNTHLAVRSGCQICASASPGCVTCKQPDIATPTVECQSCFANFTLAAGVCTCASRNCVECEPEVAGQCRSCLPTHFLNGNKTCVPCSIMPLCSECLFAGGIVCRKCISGFVMANNECTAVPPNCAQPADEVVCARCEDGFALTAQNTCTSCQAVAHCEKCIMRRGVVSCYRCENQLGLTRDRQCEKCDAVLRFDSPQCVCGAAENCGNCDASGTACQECFRGYQKIGGVCVKAKCQVENCFTCSDRPDSCMVCDSDYELTNRDTCQHRCSGQPQQGSFCKRQRAELMSGRTARSSLRRYRRCSCLVSAGRKITVRTATSCFRIGAGSALTDTKRRWGGVWSAPQALLSKSQMGSA